MWAKYNIKWLCCHFGRLLKIYNMETAYTNVNKKPGKWKYKRKLK